MMSIDHIPDWEQRLARQDGLEAPGNIRPSTDQRSIDLVFRDDKPHRPVLYLYLLQIV